MPLMQETEIRISDNLLKDMFTVPDPPDMWAPPLNFVAIILARLKPVLETDFLNFCMEGEEISQF